MEPFAEQGTKLPPTGIRKSGAGGLGQGGDY